MTTPKKSNLLKIKSNDNLMLTVIPHDFDVELIAQSNGMALFAAERDDHFHFVIDDQAEHCIDRKSTRLNSSH